MATSRFAHLALLGTLLTVSTYAQAESEILQSARTAWSRLRNDSNVPPSRPLNDSWGDNAATRRDERAQDERLRDERSTDPRFTPSPTQKVPGPLPDAPRGRTAEERMYGIRDEEEAPVLVGRAAACTNVARAWEGAAALAARGDDARAYDAYLRLLSSCSEEQELIGTAYQAMKHLSAEQLNALMAEPVLAAPALEPVLLTFKLQRMYAANKARKYEEALALSQDIREQLLAVRDAGALEVSGWLEQRARNPKAAEKLFRAALRIDRDLESAREGLVYALLAGGRIEGADHEAQRLTSASAEVVQADVLLARARESLKTEEYATALKQLDQAVRLGIEVDDTVLETKAWALKGAGEAKKAAEIFATLVENAPGSATLQQGYIDSLAASRNVKTLKALAEEETELGGLAREAVARRLDSQGRRAQAAALRGEPMEGDNGEFSASVVVRSKSGTEGEGRLTQTTVPMGTASIQIGSNVEATVAAQRISMDDGVHQATGEELRVRATTTIDDLQLTAGVGSSRSNGTDKYTYEARAKLFMDTGFLEAGISREPVFDSLRAYSGLDLQVAGEEPDTVNTVHVGRVFDTSAYVAGSSLLDSVNNYRLAWNVGGGSVAGPNDYSNGYYRLGVSLTKDFESQRFSWLSAGPYLNVQSYKQDTNRFDGLDAGYFSPTADTTLGMLVNAMSREGGNLLFKTSTKLGYASRGLYYGNDSGVSLESDGTISWLVHPSIILGVGAYLRTSPGYNDVALRLGFTIPFETRNGLYQSDLLNFKAQ